MSGGPTFYLLTYDRAPRMVDGDLAIIHDHGDATVLTSSTFRLLEARRTDRPMNGPFRDREQALAATGLADAPLAQAPPASPTTKGRHPRG